MLATKSGKVAIRDYLNTEFMDIVTYNYKDSIEPDLELYKALYIENSYVYVICMTQKKCVVVKFGVDIDKNSTRVINLGYNLIFDFFLVYNKKMFGVTHA